MESIEINWLCKHSKKVRSSQAYISVNSCTELIKTQFPLWVLLRSTTPRLSHKFLKFLIKKGEQLLCIIAFSRHLSLRLSVVLYKIHAKEFIFSKFENQQSQKLLKH